MTGLNRLLLVVCLIASSLLLTGCPASLRGDTYSRDAALRPAKVQEATIISLRPVTLEGTKTPIGAGAGTIIGGIAGSSAGGGRGSHIMAVVGAMAGGLLGGLAEEAVTRSEAVELILQIDGQEQPVAIVQAVAPNEVYVVGHRVRLITVNGQTRVSY